MSPRTRARAEPVGALVLFIVLTASLVALRMDRSPWATIGVLAVGSYLLWETFQKFTSDEPVVDWWDGHIRFFLLGASALVGGIALGLTGGDHDSGSNRLIGLLVAVVGGVLLAAERRDFRLWRADVRRDRELEARCREGSGRHERRRT